MVSARAPFRVEASLPNNYAARLAEAVSVAVRAATSIEDLCRRTCGAPPSDVLSYVIKAEFERFQKESTRPVLSSLEERIPEPHPIDYDWRFDHVTIETLTSMTRRFEHTLCVGTPTVFDSIARSHRQVTLVDRNPFLAKGLSETAFTKLFLNEIESVALPSGKYDAAILDPPWYPAMYDSWLNKVIPAIKPGGTIFLILFQELTRPTASHELHVLLNRLDRLGAITIFPRAATYVTPNFELETLRRQCVPDLYAWRQGDILQLDLPAAGKSRPSDRWMLQKPQWRRFLLAGQVVATTICSRDNGPFDYQDLESAESPFELTSVSDRNVSRRAVNIWTSRNRGARATGIERAATMLAAIAESPAGQSHPKLTPTTSELVSFHHLLRDIGFDSGAA